MRDPVRSTPGAWRTRDHVLFPALDAARREHGVPTDYYVRVHGKTVDIIVDDFFLPEETAARLAAQYADYVQSWDSSPKRRWFPRGGIGLEDFRSSHGYAALTVLREDAPQWIALLNETGPLTYKPSASFGVS
jgi:hypothetical protein